MIPANEIRERAVQFGVPETQIVRDHRGDRQAPRDLFDLYELARLQYFTSEAVAMVKTITGVAPTLAMLDHKVSLRAAQIWETELGHQRSGLPDAPQCLETVRNALAHVL